MANSAAQKALTLAGRTLQSCLVFLNLSVRRRHYFAPPGMLIDMAIGWQGQAGGDELQTKK